MGINELDRPLNFQGDSEITPLTYGSRNTATIGVDNVAYLAANGYENNAGAGKERFGEFGNIGGPAASKYSAAVRKYLHHESEYRPCKTMTAEEWEEMQCLNKLK